MKCVYAVGYSARGAQDRVDELLSGSNALLIDTRFSPYSKMPQWSVTSLKERYDNKYRWAVKCLGNDNYKGAPIMIANPAVGIRGLDQYLCEGYDLVLLCKCSQYETCHVSHIVNLLLKKTPDLEIVHQSSLVLCAVCGEPATLG